MSKYQIKKEVKFVNVDIADISQHYQLFLQSIVNDESFQNSSNQQKLQILTDNL